MSLALNTPLRPRLWSYPEGGEFHETMSQPPLPESGAHAWLCPLAEDAWLRSLLSSEENARAENMYPRNKIAEFALSRGWLRGLLAGYTGMKNPQAICIGIRDGGKSYAVDFPSIQFNLSHSGDFVVIAFSTSHSLGIDLEKIRPIPDWRGLAQGLLANSIAMEIHSLPESEQSAAFLRYFTAHEAYFKAQGTGFVKSDLARAMEIRSSGSVRGGLAMLPEIPGYVGHLYLAEKA